MGSRGKTREDKAFSFESMMEKDRVDGDYFTFKLFDKKYPKGVESRSGYIAFPNLDRLRELDLVMFAQEKFTEPNKIKKVCDAEFLSNLKGDVENQNKFLGIVSATRQQDKNYI